QDDKVRTDNASWTFFRQRIVELLPGRAAAQPSPPAARPTPRPSVILPHAPPGIGASRFADAPEGHGASSTPPRPSYCPHLALGSSHTSRSYVSYCPPPYRPHQGSRRRLPIAERPLPPARRW